MKNEEAKLILQAYRPGGRDAGDPMFAEALEQARRDPELQKWLAQEQALDSLLQARLQKAVPIPFGLKTRLLAQSKAVRPVAWWRIPFWQATVAVLVIMATLAVLWLKPTNQFQFADLRGAMVQTSLQMDDHVSHLAQDMTNVRDWLKTQNAPSDYGLPAALRDAMLKGCKVVDWHGRKVTMLCLKAGTSHVDLFVIDCTRFRDFRPSETVQFGNDNGLTTAVWCNGDKTYLLAGKVDESDLRKML